MFQIIVRTSFIAFHRWKEAPEEHKYLADLHRHTFNVEMRKEVQHEERDIEFIALRKEVDEFINKLLVQDEQTLEWSCEQWAEELCNVFYADSVMVDEDGENGAIYIYPHRRKKR